ncbi:MAG: class I SAM-dependent methyltransferase [Pseudomonadota bacterium]
MHDDWPHKAFFILHRDLPREGPGERGDVSWAAEMAALPRDGLICDAACGPGADIPALLFAAPQGHVMGFDLHPGFVADAAARFAGDGRVNIQRGRLIARDDGLPDPSALGPFDLIWCAGAAYFEGVTECLKAWAPALKPGGHVAFSEAVWLTDSPSPKLAAFWAQYPAMTDRGGVADRVRAAGYETVASRPLSDAAWEGYFGPMERRIAELRPQADAELTKVLDEGAEEAEIWRNHRDQFGYLLSVVRTRER